MKRSTRILFMVLRTALAVGIVFFLVSSGAIDWSALRGFRSAWPITLTAIGVLLAATVLTAWRLCVLMKPHGLHLSLASSLRLTFMGTFFNACLPGSTGGDVVKIYYAAEGQRGRRMEVTTIMLLDRAAGLFTLLIWPLMAAPFFPRLISSSAVLRGLLWTAATAAVAMIAGIVICFSSRLRSNGVQRWLIRKMPFGRFAERVFATLYLYRNKMGTLILVVLISLLAHTMTVGVTLLIARAINPADFGWEIILLVPLGFIANTLPLTPGGLGVGETAFDSLFILAGLTGGAEVLIGWRLLTILCGLIGLVFYLQGRKRYVNTGLATPQVKEELSFS